MPVKQTQSNPIKPNFTIDFERGFSFKDKSCPCALGNGLPATVFCKGACSSSPSGIQLSQYQKARRRK
jgi:hypothetical protein